ncbi:MAG TPA: DUF1648 domain-containing protein [Candidatus Aquilonibacter sp.]|nr:DUF1648 domain-containing protein [Candidatus Aquilonibacter sp.]
MRRGRETLALLGLTMSVVLLINGWRRMPAVIPMHFKASGVPNGYGPKLELLIVEAIGVLVYFVLLAVGQMPQRFNLSAKTDDPDRPRQEKLAMEMVGWLRLEVAWLFAYLMWAEVEIARHAQTGLGSWVVPTVVAVAIATSGTFLLRFSRGGKG